MVKIFSFLFTLLLSHAVMAMDATATLDRNLGLLIGDNITMTIQLPVDSEQLDLNSLPVEEQRYGHWLVMHQVTLLDKTLTLAMQLVNVPAENRVVNTPELSLRSKDGAFINVPSLPMQIGSFLAKNDDKGLTPKPDATLPELGSSRINMELWLSSGLFILSLLIWLAWHYGVRPHQRLPFANVMFELTKMRLLGRQDSEVASRHLHHAFNSCAGRVVLHSQLDKLWLQCPWLKPLAAEIDSFYADSSAHFFSPDASVKKDFEALRQLAKACRALEKMA